MIQATADKVTSVGTAVKLPFRGGSIVKPLATDLTAGQVLQLGWVYFRADTKGALHCRLGGEPGSADGAVGHLRLRGQRRDHLDVHGPVGPAAAAEGAPLRARLRHRRPQAVSRLSPLEAGFLSLDPESFLGSFFSDGSPLSLELLLSLEPPSPSLPVALRDPRP